ncbi:2-succinyl-5-enolpyruvyl-6-hydroxy-3-cyclohexene-1-carboxylic-acid synthase [Alicyclobacillus cycloheptanicus]|uniref:2-succinyl-5-enolpyruvyl-6-hydroxy-3-cyclohexene-1-carboxylate synthase n=1 Tax=Alicyclobacillus cycloheptanicus TaxID=1457 RepID=A0ABT9XL17_9BACL|nr:2-succinyl-5-enolpyruvyl-6-hydroxy-3-cyclohexene-1-carboxylic-acid synthase [Alicyclobacillus cycloheptanicus]MDQ0191005.1 2-succinyl-5-enolpyruvyl-6-hydroxy-3-cyclohexene-1-carboxylate synthase [Alicyclobacillus cycloheptanicus]WDM00899.1 2-succinyl-5-enolpyruvyl-6-hydroxy-3-cyclohexene-1-carboxylic-acid synthase [Alicyclobacillus cycloheptanicus]
MAENADLTVVYTFVEALRRAGVADVCISPGSRSTPLTLAFVRTGAFRVWTLLDERSAGFFAVGLARVGRPAALVCTSGSATANYHPAVMEASAARLPLIVLTADRPPELHHVGANQTTQQLDVYGHLVKWSVNMPVPLDTPALHQHAEATAWRLVQLATTAPQGPVHLNWPLREPLIPPPYQAGGRHRVVQSVAGAKLTPHDGVLDDLARVFASSSRGLMVCGPQGDPKVAEAVLQLARRLRVPVVADVLSQARRAVPAEDELCIVDLYDVWIRDRTVAEAMTPDWVLRVGAAPTSKGLLQFLERARSARQIVVDDDPNWRDPAFSATDVVLGDVAWTCRRLAEVAAPAGDLTWLRQWQDISRRARQAFERVSQQVLAGAGAAGEPSTGLAFEGQLFSELAPLLTEQHQLFLGNSMPVRDAESFLPALPVGVRVLANRGVSGIDGVVSSAVGASAGSGRRTVLVIGDVSFYHDQNGLLAAVRNGLDVVVVLVNNGGGGIFSFLPQAAYPDTFAHFRTEHGLEFEPIVRMYGGVYRCPQSLEAVRSALSEALDAPGLQVVEVKTEIERNVAVNRAVVQGVQAAVREALS